MYENLENKLQVILQLYWNTHASYRVAVFSVKQVLLVITDHCKWELFSVSMIQ